MNTVNLFQYFHVISELNIGLFLSDTCCFILIFLVTLVIVNILIRTGQNMTF